VKIVRGARALRRFLRRHTFDLRRLDAAGFRRWLAHHLEVWHQDPAFMQRCHIRDLRRAHPELRTLERELRRAMRADESSPHFPHLSAIEEELHRTGRALDGLTTAMIRTAAEKLAALEQKRDTFRTRQRDLEAERDRLLRESPQRREVLRLEAELRALRTVIGLDAEEQQLSALLREGGRHSGRAGGSFEDVALAVVREHVLPRVLREESAGDTRLLRRVTLGAARTEFDLLVVRVTSPNELVEVLAAVEAKRNLNDLAHGFRLRQENLAWLTGEAGGPDPDMYRTATFPTGRFDRPSTHDEGGETFLLTTGSFRRFRRDPVSGLFNRLYFISRRGPLWGIAAAGLARIKARVAADLHFDPEDEASLEELLAWSRALTKPVEAPDVLRRYAAAPKRAQRVILVPRE
jgi:hypothetical protein